MCNTAAVQLELKSKQVEKATNELIDMMMSYPVSNLSVDRTHDVVFPPSSTWSRKAGYLHFSINLIFERVLSKLCHILSK